MMTLAIPFAGRQNNYSGKKQGKKVFMVNCRKMRNGVRRNDQGRICIPSSSL